MSELLVKCEKELKNLSKIPESKQIAIIKKCNKCLIKAISEIVRNCMLGNIKLNNCKKEKLKPYKKVLKILGAKYIPLESKKR